MKYRPGRHFLQLPGPSNVPERVLQAMSRATIDHRGREFPALTGRVLEGLRSIFRTSGRVLVYPASGSGGWEAALSNVLSPRERVLMFETGVFALGWVDTARRFGLDVTVVPGDWRRGADPAGLEELLTEDREHRIRAVAVVHNETSTGAVTRIAGIRQAIDNARHPALLMVDAISSLGSIDYRHDEWRVDVTIAASQKGLMLPPGLAFHAVSGRALEASARATLPRAYFDWARMAVANDDGFFPYTPATNLLFGLREALAMLEEEGFDNVLRRHARLAEATRQAVRAWKLETQCVCAEEHSNVLTAVVMPEGHDGDRFRALVDQRFNMSLGAGLGKLKGRIFRIGHVGDFNELMLAGTLAGVEMGLALSAVPFRRGGVDTALRWLVANE